MKGNMERVLLYKAVALYPEQWIVFVNVRREPEEHASSGEVYWVTSNEDEAYEISGALGDEYGCSCVWEGYNERPEIGWLRL